MPSVLPPRSSASAGSSKSNEVKELRDPKLTSSRSSSTSGIGIRARRIARPRAYCGIIALFDKPYSLEGPFFEETIYVTPSQVNTGIQAQITMAVTRAAHSLGLHHGPIHAEVRFNSRGPVRARSRGPAIGGLCAKSLRLEQGGQRVGFEDLLLLHAAGLSIDASGT